MELKIQKYKNKKQYRYKNYDYSRNGFYFVTICTKNKFLFFGDMVDSKMKLSEIGKIVEKYWLEIPAHFPFVKLDKFVVMPNYIHGIVQIDNELQNAAFGVGTQNLAFLRGAPHQCEYQNKFGPQSKNLSSIIRGFKIGVTKFAKNNNIVFAWQSRFHDRIIRNDDELNRIRKYIIDNPARWELDRNNGNDLFI